MALPLPSLYKQQQSKSTKVGLTPGAEFPGDCLCLDIGLCLQTKQQRGANEAKEGSTK